MASVTLSARSHCYGVPRNAACLWNTYEFQQGDIKGLKFGGGVTLRDGQLACCDMPAYSIPGYATVDLLAAYSPVQLNVNNLLDKNYYTGLNTQFNSAYLVPERKSRFLKKYQHQNDVINIWL